MSESRIGVVGIVIESEGNIVTINQVLHDLRDPSKVVYSQLSMPQPRIYGLCRCQKSLNDHRALRNDPAGYTLDLIARSATPFPPERTGRD